MAEQPVNDPDNPAEMSLPDCTSFIQIPSPSVDAPPDLDVNQIGEIYLQVLGMSPEEAASFSKNVDWTSTFVIPVPQYSSTNEQVPVDGVTGTLIKYRESGRQAFLLIWVKDGIIYAFGGPGKGNDALQIVASLK